MAKAKPIDVDVVRQWLRYSPRTGQLRWLKYPGGRGRVGEVAGCGNHKGYVRIKIKGHGLLTAHRLAWVIHHGYDVPRGKQIDHVNGHRSDNRIVNLRLASISENHHNSRVHKSHEVGLKGVYRSRSKFAAKVKPANGARVYLGVFDTPEEAHDAYMNAAKMLCGEFASDGG